MASITKDMFVIGTLRNRITKAHKEMERENVSKHMPEYSEMPEYCKVRIFETYLEQLHPQCNKLWQFR